MMISEIQFLATMPKNVRGRWFTPLTHTILRSNNKLHTRLTDIIELVHALFKINSKEVKIQLIELTALV